MFDPYTYLAQAGFGEQIALYDRTFWQQVASAFWWAFITIFPVLLFVAVVVTVSGQTKTNEETDSSRRRTTESATRAETTPRDRV